MKASKKKKPDFTLRRELQSRVAASLPPDAPDAVEMVRRLRNSDDAAQPKRALSKRNKTPARKRESRQQLKTLTVRQLPADAHEAFRIVAAANGRSMEEEARQMIIARAGVRAKPDLGPLRAMRERIKARHGGKLPPELFQDYLREKRATAAKEWAELHGETKGKRK